MNKHNIRVMEITNERNEYTLGNMHFFTVFLFSSLFRPSIRFTIRSFLLFFLFARLVQLKVRVKKQQTPFFDSPHASHKRVSVCLDVASRSSFFLMQGY